MSSTVIEAFLLIEQPRQRLGHWTAALATLDSPLAPAPVAVVAYYDPSSDQALLNLQYDPVVLGDRKLDFVVQVALLAEVGMVQPSELSEGERMRFLSARLSRCTIRVTSQSSGVGALSELVRKIKSERAPQPAMKPLALPPVPARPRVPMPAPRGRVDEMLVTAKGTRDNLERVSPQPSLDIIELTPADVVAIGTRDNLRALTAAELDAIPEIAVDESRPSSRLPTVDISPPLRVPAPLSPADLSPPPTSIEGLSSQTSRHVLVRSSRFSTVEMPRDVARQLASAPPTDTEEDRTTSPMNLDKLQALAATADARPPRRLRPPTENDFAEEDDVRPPTMPALRKTARALAPLKRRPPSAPYATAQQPNIIYARYLRGGRWVPARVGALNLNGAALLAGALPRVADRVDIALTFGSTRALVRGVVAKVSSMREASVTGASTFTVSFQLDTVSKRQLTALLVAARDAKITIKPPPPRATRRFPVEWNLGLAVPSGTVVKAVALDVSTGGMFVRSPVVLELDMSAGFSVVLDDGGAPVVGRAKVARKITEAEARACGLAAGFGLTILEMSEPDRMRWLGFLARIERRADKRVLIGADPARLAELQAGLASLGYAVSGGTDPGTLVQLASGDSRPADVVLIDAGWLHNESSMSLVESLFSARNVPCVTMHGEVRRARQAIDRLLEVVV